MPSARRIFLLLLLLSPPGIGCGEEEPASDGARDAGIGDGISPPDFGAARDGLRAANVGSPCDPKMRQGCTAPAECLQLAGGVGICAIRGCAREDINKSGKEDNCPPLPAYAPRQTVCTPVQIPGDGGFQTVNYCLPGCQASTKENTCAAINPQLTCDPVTVLLTGYSEVCMVTSCTETSHCGKDPIRPTATCNKATGTCQTSGTPGVTIGSPCKVSADCGVGQFCMPESHDPKTGKTLFAGGYCTIVGCAHNDGSNDLWKCPDGSTCFLLGSSKALSLCLAVGCNPAAAPEKDGCRDQSPAGQYACTVQSGFNICWVAATR